MTTAQTTSAASDQRAAVAPLLNQRRAVAIGLVSIAFVGLFFRWIWFQHRHSAAAIEDWGHAYLIPLISLYYIWINRDKLARLRAETFWPGLAPLTLGIMSYFCCVVVIHNHMLQGLSVLLTLFGAVLTLVGPAMIRLLFLPIAFLVFAITVSEAIMIRITFPLQLIAAEGANITLSALGAVFGFASDVNGNVLTVIDSSGVEHPLNVAEACSGMRMVIAFIALAGCVALLGAKTWWQRIAIMLLSAPVALLMNIVRVAVLGLLSMADAELASGDAHTFIGTLLLLPALGLFMLVIWALDRIVVETPKPNAEAKP